MKTVTSVAWVVLIGLSACAAGSKQDGTFTGSSAGTSPDAGGAVVIVGNGTGSSSEGSTDPNGGNDAGGSTSVNTGNSGGNEGFDAGDGFDDDAGEFGGFDAGSGFDDDAGEFGGFDAGSGFDDDAGGYGYDSGEYGYDAGGAGSSCGYADPDTPANCTCSASDPSECQANGCYGGYYCDTNTDKCKSSLPSGC